MNKPHAITRKEWAKIIKVPEVIEGWGIEPDETPEFLADMIYGVRFDFISGGPGYVGPLYLLQGDGDPGTAPVALIKRGGELVAL
jgi:hypothetical protein